MALDFTRDPTASGFQSADSIEGNFQKLETMAADGLSRSGNAPNAMAADLDMNSNRIINLPNATSNGEPITYAQWASQTTTVEFDGYLSEEQTAIADQTSFTLANTYTPGLGALRVYINGVFQTPSAYTETDANTITFSEGLDADDTVTFIISSFTAAESTGGNNITFTPAGSGAVASNVQTKLRESISVKDFGAIGDGVTDDTTEVDAAVAAAGTSQSEVVTPDGSYLVTALDNDYGVEFDGTGEIIKAVTGGYQRLDSYADKHKYAIGKEYLFRMYERMALGQSSSSGTINCYLYGDSTIAGGNGESSNYTTTSIIQSIFKAKGLGNILVTNQGVGATMMTDMPITPADISDGDVFIIKYGINDGGNPLATRLATFKNDLHTKLAAIRAATGGGLSTLAILLVGPNSTSDSTNDRDERWYEQLRGVYVAAAREYNCAYFDTYAYLKDSRPAAGMWMDDPYADGRAIHPLDEMQAWIWGGILDWAINSGESTTYRSNRVTNQGAVSDTWSSSNIPSTYKNGIHIQRAQVANGAPFEGVAITTRNVDQPTIQELFGYGSGITKRVFRTAYVSGDSWNRWTGGVVPENLTLQNSWASIGGSYGTPSAAIDGAGFCHVKGAIDSGTTTAATVIATLPTGMRPAESSVHVVATDAGTAQIEVQADGDIVAKTTLDATATYLDGIVFKVA